MNVQKSGSAAVRVILTLTAGATGGVSLADADLTSAAGGAAFPKVVLNASMIEWRDVPTEADGSAFLSLTWRAIEPVQDTTFYDARITVVDEPGGALLGGQNPKERQNCKIGDVVPGVGDDAEPIIIT